jgi:hypothetical protein
MCVWFTKASLETSVPYNVIRTLDEAALVIFYFNIYLRILANLSL